MAIKLTKRRRFIVTSVLLSIGFIGIIYLGREYLDSFVRISSILGLGVLTLILFSWSLKEGLGKNATLLTLLLPFFFTIGVGLFWFLLPSTFWVRFPIVILFGLGIYTLCLTANIYTVATIRTIALLRAARGVGFVLTLITFFLVFDAILSLKLPFLATAGLVTAFSFPLFLQGFWSIPLDKVISKDLIFNSLAASLVMGEIAMSLYFWPVTVVVGSLFFTVTCYILLGLGQAKLEGRLFKQTVREYLTIGAVVTIGMFLATKWG